jgi:tetratricopeptide (TPR) repeat protein
MELVLDLHNGNQVWVACDGRASHAFALETVNAADPGALYNALFPPKTLARAALASADHLALVLDEVLDSLPWELSRGPEGDLALQMPLVRLVPPDSRRPAPKLDSPLRVLAVPSNPAARDVPPLNIAGELRRLREVVGKLTHCVRLERVNPPTLDSLRQAALRSPQAVIHFMGHGGQTDQEAVLFFESDAGGLQPVTAKDFALSVGKQAFLVTLNACVSAAPGPTEFSNLARLLVQRGLPYALGMSASIPDGDALTFSRALYGELAAGVDVEQAVFQARRSLLRGNPREWLVGVPVLYSSLEGPAGGFATPEGQPQIDEGGPPLDVTVLPRAEGAFQGRIDELLALGQALTGEPRPSLLTIHGAGGQGKTALAREAVERFAHAWPGGVWAVSLENKPNRVTFCFQLAQFLKIPAENFPQPADLERILLARLADRRMLIVLDNAETFTAAVRAGDADALELAAFLKEGLLGTDAGLLVTSREPLGWPGEQSLPLEGLSQSEGAALFTQSAPQRGNDIQAAQAAALSARLDGHPLALLLLGLAFNEAAIPLEQFIAEHETRLLNAEDKYKAADHRHRTLYASIETSTRYLSEDERALLSGLWIFQSPFQPQVVSQIFAPSDLPEAKTHQEQIFERLNILYRRGLLLREIETLSDGSILLYRNLPTVRLFASHYLEQTQSVETLLARMGKAHAALLQNIYEQMDYSNWASYLVVRCREDLEACLEWVESADNEMGWYPNLLGSVLQRVGDRQAGLRYLEQALAIAQGTNQKLEIHILNNIAMLYGDTGNPSKALVIYEQALSLSRILDNREGEIATLGNMATVYLAIGQPDKALGLFEQALPFVYVLGDQAAEATILNNMGEIYRAIGNLSKALDLYKQALPIQREMGNRRGEAAILNNMGEVYRVIGQPNKALELYEQVLQITHTIGERAGEANAINNMGIVYRATGQPGKALELFNQALLMHREVGNRAMEATTLNNMALVYNAIGNPGRALELYEQTLPMHREVGNRTMEATTLNNMGEVYRADGQLSKALELYEQALPIHREVGNREVETSTLNNIALVYHATGQSDKALGLFEQALSIARAIGNRVGEATVLHNIAGEYRDSGKQGKALELYEQVLSLERAVGDQSGEAVTCFNMAILLRDMDQVGRAVMYLRQAVVLEKQIQHPNYLQDAEMLTQWEAAIVRGDPILSRLSSKTNRQPSANPPALPADFVARCVGGLTGDIAQKMSLADELAALAKSSADAGALALIDTVQRALFGAPIESLGQDLPEMQAQVWQEIAHSAKTGENHRPL